MAVYAAHLAAKAIVPAMVGPAFAVIATATMVATTIVAEIVVVVIVVFAARGVGGVLAHGIVAGRRKFHRATCQGSLSFMHKHVGVQLRECHR
jgi:hypothetical protein